jgi:penicillin-insensitive murein endopeptidase
MCRVLLFLVIVACSTQSWAQVPTAKEARKLIRAPRGSLSFGYTNSGELRHGAVLAPEGPGYRLLPGYRARHTNYGTAELVGLIKRAGLGLKKKHAKAILGVGNLSREGGGQTGGSVSHKSGRDVDLGMFALTKKGQPHNLKSFVGFQEDGWDKRRRFRFDPERNLDLVLLLANDSKTPVQVIFVADWLKDILMAEATKRKLGVQILAKLQTLLRQPSDSNPHHHHYHLRIYCSKEDRRHGCLERGDVHPWVDLGDEAFEARVTSLSRLLTMKQARWRRIGAEKLGELRARSALSALLNASEDADPKVQGAALHALGAIAAPEAYAPLETLLLKTRSARHMERLLQALLRIELPDLERTALAALERLATLAEPWSKAEKRRVKLAVLAVLKRFGRKQAAVVLRQLLGDSDRRVATQAHAALRRITNQPMRGRRVSRRSRPKIIKRWNAFFEAHGESSWAEWLKLGFAKRGIKLPAGPGPLAAAPQLIQALKHRDDDVAHNASLLLMKLTDHVAYPWWRKKRNNQRHWRAWFRENHPGLFSL